MHATRVEAIPHLDQEQAGKERRISDIPNPIRARPFLRKGEIAAAAAPRLLVPLTQGKLIFFFFGFCRSTEASPRFHLKHMPTARSMV
jgi:hypothetical protein